jgi:hypothetical protein
MLRSNFNGRTSEEELCSADFDNAESEEGETEKRLLV